MRLTLTNYQGSTLASVPDAGMRICCGCGEIEDPYYRDNEEAIQWIGEKEWIYERSFIVDEFLESEKLELEFVGLDTVTSISLNGELLGKTNNMFIPWVFDVKPLLKEGENTLQSLSILSSIMGLNYKNAVVLWLAVIMIIVLKIVLGSVKCLATMAGIGAEMVTAGIWKSVSLNACSGESKTRPVGGETRTFRQWLCCFGNFCGG